LKLFTTALIIFLTSLTFVPPAAALNPSRSISQYKHTRWSIDDGAPLNVISLAQGPSGYLWIGSSAGLFRFDGVKFEAILARDGSETHGVSTLAVMPNGDVWVGYGEGGTSLYRHGELNNVPAPTPDYVMDFARVPNRGLLATLGRSDHQLMQLNNGHWSDVAASLGLPNEQPVKMFASRDGAVWLTTLGSLMVLHAGAARFERVPVTLRGHASMCQDKQGRLWLSDDAGTRVFDPGKSKRLVYPTPSAKRKVHTLIDRDGILWGITLNSIFRIRSPSDSPPSSALTRAAAVDTFEAKDGLSAKTVNTIFEDREGNLWIGSDQGLERFRSARVVVEPLLTKPAFFGDALLSARDGTVYVGESGAVYRIRPGGSPERLLQVAEAQALCEGLDGSIWIVAQDDVVRMKSGRFSKIGGPPNVKGKVSDCATDQTGKLWLASTGQGLYGLEDGRWKQLREGPGISNFSPLTLLPTPERRLLIATEDRTLVDLNPPSQARTVVKQTSGLGRLHTLYATKTGVLIGAESGLARLTNGVVTALDDKLYPQIRSIGGIAQTPTGQTWMSVAAGIVGVPTAAIDRAFNAPGAKIGGLALDFRDGLEGRQSRDANHAVVRGGDGRLWFATVTGTVWIDPDHLPMNRVSPPTTLSAVKAGGIIYRDPLALSLPAGTSNVEIDFAAPSLSIPERVQVRYQMVGDGRGWVDPGSRRQAFYTNLKPGNYTFKVMAANDDGVWAPNGSKLDFKIPPTFLQSLFFKAIVALVVFLLLWCGYLVRFNHVTAQMRAKLEDRLAERERIARDLHDTLLQGFQGLILRFQSVANEIPQGQPVRTLIDQALDSADGALKEGRDSVRHLRATHSQNIAEVFAETAAKLQDDHPIRFDMAIEGAPLRLHPVVHEELCQIGNEALINAFRHSKAATIELTLSYRPSGLFCCVSDDGIGIDAAIVEMGGRQGHFGLVGMRERAEQIQTELQVLSRPGGGTEIQIVAPARVAYADPQRLPWIRWFAIPFFPRLA